MLTSTYIRCAHSGTSTLALRARLRRCASLHHHHHKKKNKKNDIAHTGKRTCMQAPSDSKSIALTTRPPRLLCLIPEASYVYLAENALNALLSSAWDNGVSQSVSQWVSEWVSDSRALVIRLTIKILICMAFRTAANSFFVLFDWLYF